MTDEQPTGSSGQIVLGVDVGGSGIKAAEVDLHTGSATGRIRLETPQPATPDAVAKTVADLVAHFDVGGNIGCTVPAVVRHGVVRTAAHIDHAWIGTDASKVFSSATGRRCVALNDADAAGIAEARYGAARDTPGLVVMITIGTGVGTALLLDGELIPNSELGHIIVNRHLADTWVSDAARTNDDVSWKRWSSRLNRYLTHLNDLIWPECFVIGGGIVKHEAKFLDRIDPGCEVRMAKLGNLAGIVGAAVAANETGS